ncbi:MAG TPA: zinc ribbon domain-containing protein [Gemmataceae bacterium]|nr:zinc ribbon domain-containing protein [Gemmataceae bacterium]
MPLYDFTCDDCGTRFERLVRREADVSEVDCPDCGGRQVSRALSLPAAPVSAAPAAGPSCGVGPPCGAPWCQRKG